MNAKCVGLPWKQWRSGSVGRTSKPFLNGLLKRRESTVVTSAINGESRRFEKAVGVKPVGVKLVLWREKPLSRAIKHFEDACDKLDYRAEQEHDDWVKDKQEDSDDEVVKK